MPPSSSHIIICLSLILIIVGIHVFASFEYFQITMDYPANFEGPNTNSVYSSFPSSSTWTTDYGIPFGNTCLGRNKENPGQCQKNQTFTCSLSPHNKYSCSWS